MDTNEIRHHQSITSNDNGCNEQTKGISFLFIAHLNKVAPVMQRIVNYV